MYSLSALPTELSKGITTHILLIYSIRTDSGPATQAILHQRKILPPQQGLFWHLELNLVPANSGRNTGKVLEFLKRFLVLGIESPSPLNDVLYPATPGLFEWML